MSKMNNKILFLVSANKEIGMGHLMRSNRLSNELKRINYHTSIVFIENVEKKLPLNKNFNKIYYIKKNSNKFKHVLVLILKIDPKLIIIDLPKPNINFEKSLFERGKKFLIYDNLSRKKIYSNFLINLNPLVKKEKYKNKVLSKCKLLIGPKYFPINSKKHNKKISIKIRKVLIFIGGGENNINLIKKIFKTISKSKINDVKFIFISMQKLKIYEKEKIKKKDDLDIIFINNTKNIYKYLKKADISIITAGSISFESCFFSLPMILLSISKNQIPIAKSWHSLTAGIYIGKSNSDKFQINLYNAIDELFLSKKRIIMSNNQKKIFNTMKPNIINNFK